MISYTVGRSRSPQTIVLRVSHPARRGFHYHNGYYREDYESKVWGYLGCRLPMVQVSFLLLRVVMPVTNRIVSVAEDEDESIEEWNYEGL